MIPQPFDTDDPLDRRWRSAVLWTIHDLKHSTVRRRTLSLPNLCRIFERRWHAAQPASDVMGRGRELGRLFLHQYYHAHQTFLSAARPAGIPRSLATRDSYSKRWVGARESL